MLADPIFSDQWEDRKVVADPIFVEVGILLTPSTQLSDEDWLNTPDENAVYYYALAGSWTYFIIEKCGIDAFKNLYIHTNSTQSREEIISAYNTYLGKPLNELEEEYFRFINQ